ncbi:MAG: hypothetical protein AAGF58_12540 [Pseudomonadota bacterium]
MTPRERVKIRRQFQTILGKMKYPVNNSMDLVRQVGDEKLDIWDATIDFSKVSKNAYFSSFISESDFPVKNEEDLKEKYHKALSRFLKLELRKLNGAKVTMGQREDFDDPRDSITLQILAKYKFVGLQ